MKVVLTKKLAEYMDGVDVRGCDVGSVLDLAPLEARALVAEQWAIPDRRHHAGPSPQIERRQRRWRSDFTDVVERAS